MPFKKGDSRAIEAGKKGGKTTQDFHREKVLKNLHRGRPEMCRKFNKDKTHQSNAGKRSRHWENKKAEELKETYDEVFQPFRVCDRICFKNGKLVFVEIKRKNRRKIRKLTPTQKQFKKLCELFGYKYIVVSI